VYRAPHILQLFLLLSFAFYGMHCCISIGAVAEFERYRLSRYRRWVGGLELLASFALAVGFYYSALAAAASLGLAVLMLLGVAARLRVGDGFQAILPAAVYATLSLILFWSITRL